MGADLKPTSRIDLFGSKSGTCSMTAPAQTAAIIIDALRISYERGFVLNLAKLTVNACHSAILVM